MKPAKITQDLTPQITSNGPILMGSVEHAGIAYQIEADLPGCWLNVILGDKTESYEIDEDGDVVSNGWGEPVTEAWHDDDFAVLTEMVADAAAAQN